MPSHSRKLITVCFAVLTLIIMSSCATTRFQEPEYQSTLALLNEAETHCKKNIDNEVLSRKHCFPLLEQRRLLVKVYEVRAAKDNSKVTVYGHGGSESHRVLCKATPELTKKIVAHPEWLRVGDRVWVRGNFESFSTQYPHQFYTLEDCSIEQWSASTQ